MRDKICIYGCGSNGIYLYYRLKLHGVKILFFVDRNPKKWGYVLAGIECISYEMLLCEDRDLSIVVSVEYPCDIVNDLKQKGFYNTISWKELGACGRENRIDIVPIKNITKLKAMKQEIEEGLSGRKMEFENEEVKDLLNDYWMRVENENR